MTTRTRAFAAVVMLVTTACRGAGVPASPTTDRRLPDPPDEVRRAGAAMMVTRGARVRFELVSVLVVPGHPAETAGTTVKGEGSYDFVDRRGSYTLSVQSLGGVGIESVEAVNAGGALYLRMSKPTGGARRWLRIDGDSLRGVGAADPTALAQAYAVDPLHALQLLQGATADTSLVGPVVINGEDTLRYRVPVDLGQAMRSAPSDVRHGLELLLPAANPHRTLVLDAWIDSAIRVRRLAYVLEWRKGSAPASGPEVGVRTVVTIETSDFGIAVEARPPPPTEVWDFDELTGGMSSRAATGATPARSGDGVRRPARRRRHRRRSAAEEAPRRPVWGRQFGTAPPSRI